jgi:hypothetical protein
MRAGVALLALRRGNRRARRNLRGEDRQQQLVKLCVRSLVGVSTTGEKTHGPSAALARDDRCGRRRAHSGARDPVRGSIARLIHRALWPRPYLQRFEYRAATKSEFDQAWTVALQTFARTGNWGGAEAGIRYVKTYATAWGGYVLLEVDDAEAFGRYQLHHAMNYGHRADITFEGLFDLDAGLAQRVREIRTT